MLGAVESSGGSGFPKCFSVFIHTTLGCLCCCHKKAQAGEHRNNGHLCLPVLEAGSLTSGCQQGRILVRMSSRSQAAPCNLM